MNTLHRKMKWSQYFPNGAQARIQLVLPGGGSKRLGAALRPPVGPGRSPDGGPGGEAPGFPRFTMRNLYTKLMYNNGKKA